MLKFVQSRVICCIFYSLDDIFLFIDKLNLDKGRYAYIHHDKDTNKDGSPKAPHYHFIARRHSPFTPQTLTNLIARCSQNVFVENLKSTEQAVIGYFTHDECEDKVKYDSADIVANFDVNRFFATTSKSQYIDPADIIAMFDDGFTTIDVIRRYPKLLYSVSNLTKTEMLIREQKRQRDITAHIKARYRDVPPPVVQMQVLPDDADLPF